MKRLTDYVPVETAQKLEGKFLQQYINDGWLPINLKKTGGLGGNIRFDGFTFEECEEIGHKYAKRNEWKEKDYSSYYIAQKFGWIDKIIKARERWSNKGAYWTKERIASIVPKYKTISELEKDEPGAYNIACRQGWAEELFASLERKHVKLNLTIEQIIEKINQYDSITDFVKNEKQMYNWCSHRRIRLTEISDKPIKWNTPKKVVYQYTLEGVLVRRYDCARDAAKEGFDYKKISAVCHGQRKQHMGFIFSFSPDGVKPIESKPPKKKENK